MTVGKLALRAGVNTNATQTMNEGGWSLCNLIRWKNGFLEKMGGWKRLFNQPAIGYVRAIHAYEDLIPELDLLLGTDGGAQIYVNNTLYNLSLASKTSSLLNQLSIASAVGSHVVTVTDTAHGAIVGSQVFIAIPYSTGGRVIYPQIVTVATVPNANTWTFVDTGILATTTSQNGVPFFGSTAGSPIILVSLTAHGFTTGNSFQVNYDVAWSATAGIPDAVTPAGNYVVTVVSPNSFQIDSGTPANASGVGFELSANKMIVQYLSAAPTSPQNWFLDNLGQNGLISYTDSPIFNYSPPVPLNGTPVAPVLANAPKINSGMFVAMPQAQIVAFGSEVIINGGTQDPLLLRWCDAGDSSVWNAASSNQAGSYRLSRGSRIIGGLQAPQTTLIWTDTDLWSMQYNGPPFVYGFTIVGTGCGLISPKARATIGGVTYWMGRDGFWRYDGGSVAPLPCDVWDIVFTNIDRSNVNKCHAGASSSFQDMYFYYPSLTGGGEIDSYVKVNFSTGTPLWDYGKLTRTAWIDNNVFGPPMGADGNFRIQQHETGYDNDDQPMTGSYAESGMFTISDGDDILSIQQIQPDCKFFGPNGYNMLTLWSQNYAGGAVRMSGPYPMTPTTQFVSPRVRARQMALRIDLCPVKGASSRLGRIQGQVSTSG